MIAMTTSSSIKVKPALRLLAVRLKDGMSPNPSFDGKAVMENTETLAWNQSKRSNALGRSSVFCMANKSIRHFKGNDVKENFEPLIVSIIGNLNSKIRVVMDQMTLVARNMLFSAPPKRLCINSQSTCVQVNPKLFFQDMVHLPVWFLLVQSQSVSWWNRSFKVRMNASKRPV